MKMVKVRQVFEETPPIDLEEELRRQILTQGLLEKVSPGMKVGITAGSRGIAQIDSITLAVAEILKEHGAHPVVFAAMGSHGGGTEEGQLEILKALNITKETIGVPVIASGDCQCIDEVDGFPVYVNKLALSFDGLVVINRVKPHTSFNSQIESGLTKMLAVGVGGPQGAEVVHSKGSGKVSEILEEVGQVLMERLPILMGVAVVEDKRHQIKLLRVCRKEKFLETDLNLLTEARKELPFLPFKEIDVLVVNEMGKCYSGTGMDTNVIGRFGIRGLTDKGIKINILVVLDLAQGSHGNANGVGLADITTEKLVKKINYQNTLKNVLTTSFLERAKIPAALKNDREAIETAVALLHKNPEDITMVNIQNTLEIEEFYVSPNLADSQGLEVVKSGQQMVFDDKGNLVGYDACR